MSTLGVLIIVVGLIAVILLLVLMSARLFKKVGPNEAMIVYGLGGTKVVKGGGRIVWPMIQQSRQLSLELMSFDVAPTQDLYSSQGVAVNVEAVAQIKVQSDPSGDGRAPARDHRSVGGRAHRQGTGDGGRPHARQRRR
jgi:flotillin